ncbi:MAG: hypothetical protein KME21_29725 [Desmonostoc vinosum HA7617-LM4]|nr:hypothetical protein [Desmonostoc vinosum HA7617-LM4]
MGNGEWGIGNGELGMGNGEWGMGNLVISPLVLSTFVMDGLVLPIPCSLMKH